MKSITVLNIFLKALCTSVALWSTIPANAEDAIDVQKLLTANGCSGCHAKDKRIVGPAFHEVAQKYAGDAQAAAKIAANIRSGGVGRWGQVPMPPMKSLTDADLAALAAYVLMQ